MHGGADELSKVRHGLLRERDGPDPGVCLDFHEDLIRAEDIGGVGWPDRVGMGEPWIGRAKSHESTVVVERPVGAEGRAIRELHVQDRAEWSAY